MADAYWQEKLRGVEVTVFPDLTGRSPSKKREILGHETFKHSISFDERPSELDTTLYVVAAWSKVIALLLGEDDFVVDFTRSNWLRPRRTQDAAPVPLRMSNSRVAYNGDLMSRIEETIQDACNWGSPSDSVRQDLLNSGQICFSDVLIVLQDCPMLKPISIPPFYDQYNFILEFYLLDSEPELVVNFHFARSVLLSDDISHVSALLDDALSTLRHQEGNSCLNSDPRTSNIQMAISNRDCKAVNCTSGETVHAAFERHVLQKPGEIALDYLNDDQTRTKWTYSMLDSLANKIADTLTCQYAIEAEDSVPICVPKSPAFYACVLGILKAGGTFTPFIGSPEKRKRFMLEELESKVVICTDEQDMAWCEEIELFNISPLLQLSTDVRHAYAQQEKRFISPSQLCYQMYTSGSTGQPKAVNLEHCNAVQTSHVARDLVPWDLDSRVLQQAGITFDMCYFETFFAWTAGICLCSASDNQIYNRLTNVINEMNITLIGLTPSVALTLDPHAVPGIRWMYCIGEALPQSLVDTWRGRLVNSYGPTEAAQMVTLFPVDRDVKSNVIGKPFDNTTFIVLQKDSTECLPALAVGELCIGGFQVARNYHKNAKKTEQAFIALEGRKFYRTGDLVRMLSNGTFEFIGRVDDQVKIRGQRVELGEVNKALEVSHAAIERASAQILKVGHQAKNQLVAFLQLQKGSDDGDEDAIRRNTISSLSDALPAYMVPQIILFVHRIPLSPSGKVDKKALTTILRESNEITQDHHETSDQDSSEVHETLRHVYSQVSGAPREQITSHISIYQLGMDSISAISVARLLCEMHFNIQASDVMKYPTIKELASFLKSGQLFPSTSGEVVESSFDFNEFDRRCRPHVAKHFDTSNNKIATIRPASPLQSSMVVQSGNSSGQTYFNHLTYQLPDGTDISRFQQAWECLVAKYEILRSGFVPLDDAENAIAMVTYRIGSLPVPFYHIKDTDIDISTRRSRFATTAVQNLQEPPWMVMVVDGQDKFYMSAHHALYDAQVLEMLLRDLALAYDINKLAEPITIGNHLAVFLNERKSTSDVHAAFWNDLGKKAVASTFPTLHPYYADRNRTKCVSGLSCLPLTKLEEGCRRSGITVQAAAQASWSCLLGALLGEKSVTFGTVLSGRVTHDAVEVGFPLITTVPTVVNNATTVSDRVKSLMRFNADVQKHQFVPLNKIQNSMGFAGETLFDTILTYQKRTPFETETTTKFEFVDNDLSIEYPVSVELEPTVSGCLQVSIYYQSKYMLDEQAELLVDQYHFVLENIIAGKHEMLEPDVAKADSRLFSVTPAKHTALPSSFKLVHESVEFEAEVNPEKIALEFITSLEVVEIERQFYSYRQLDLEGNKIASWLQIHGINQGDIVCICFDKCPEAAFAMVGILKAGCAFLALDTGAPMDRQRFIMEDSGVEIVLSKGSIADALRRSLDIHVIDLEKEDMRDCSSQPPILGRPIDPEETSYCLYTSGTTGTPKGCLISHENVVQVFCCFEKLYDHSKESRWLQFASYHFDVSVMEHFWSWFVGMTVVKASRDLILQDLSAAISRLEITHIDLTPSLARLLDPKDVPTLANGVFVTGGEMLRRDIIDVWGDSGAIHNAYGPTEATIGVTMYRGVPKNGHPSNIGWPFHVVGTFVVDPDDPTRPVLRGGAGELCVSGKLVAKGYLRRDELNKQRFINIAGQRCYRTGDMVRILADGSISFLGRTDDQVKLRGQRLETGEINSVIKQGSIDVDDVSTYVLKHPKQQKEQLVAFVVLDNSKADCEELSLCTNSRDQTTLSRIRATCVDKLPSYMVPTHILVVNKIPLSANNKIERRQLKALYENMNVTALQKASEEADFTTSASAKEVVRKISEILAHVVGTNVDRISSSSAVFELGLDSVSVINFSRALRTNGFETATPSLIMRNISVSRLAHALTTNESASQDSLTKRAKQDLSAFAHRQKALLARDGIVELDEVETIAPCTPLQAGMISRSLESNRGLYFSTFCFDLNPTADLKRLHEACQRVCDQAQILRAVFYPTEDGYVQAIRREIKVPWVYDRVSSNEELQNKLEISREHWWKRNRDSFMQPFEIVIITTPEITVFTLHIFHALYDGNSLPLLLKCVTHEYFGNIRFTYGPPFLEALAHGPARESPGAKGFWLDHLSRINELPNPDISSLSSSRASNDTLVTYNIQPINNFEECRRKLNVTSQAVVQACWVLLLQETMRMPLVTGMVVSGRSTDLTDAERVIGPLFNTIPFMLMPEVGDNWSSVILRCHDFNSAALPFQQTALRDIQKWTRRQSGQNPLFETLFVFQKQVAAESDLKMPWTRRKENFEADYPLAAEVEQALDGSFIVTLACQAHVIDEQASKTLLSRFEVLLRSVVENVQARLSEHLDLSDLILHERLNAHEDNRNVKGLNVLRSNGEGNVDRNIPHHILDNVQSEIAKLASVEVSGIESHTSIFELGLDSIDAVRLASRLKKSIGVQVSVGQIMKLSTVDKIAMEASRIMETSSASGTGYNLRRAAAVIEESFQRSNLDMDHVERVLPCTPLQEGMIADMLSSGFKRYFNSDVLLLDPIVDIDKLEAAWKEVVQVVPVLRSRFVEIMDSSIDSTFAQVIMKPPSFDWKRLTSVEDFGDIQNDILFDVQKSYQHHPALRLRLIDRPNTPDRRYLILMLPHAMYDGFSLGLVHDLVHKAYRQESLEMTQPESALSKIMDSSSESSRQFWRHALSDISPTMFPTKSAKADEIHRSSAICHVSLSSVLAFCRHSKVTISALSQTVWAIVLGYYTQQLDVSFGQVLSGRTDESTEQVVFPTINTVISRSFLHGTRSEMVQYVQEQLAAVSEHQHYPLRKALGLTPGTNKREIFDTLFIFQKSSVRTMSTSKQLYESIEGHSSVEYPVCVEAEIANDELIWRTACKASYLNKDETEMLLTRLSDVLEQIVTRPDRPVVDFTDEMVSLCGLPRFAQYQGRNSHSHVNGSSTEVHEERQLSRTEQTVRDIISKVARMDVDEIKLNSNILGLGLDSISTIKVSSLLRKQGVQISVNEMLAAATVQEIAERASTIGQSQSEPNAGMKMPQAQDYHHQMPNTLLNHSEIRRTCVESSIKTQDIDDVLPASVGQIHMLSRWQNEGVYYSTLTFKIVSHKNVENLKTAWQLLVQQTSILRTIFVATGDINYPIVQVVLKDPEARFSELPSKSCLEEEASREYLAREGGPKPPCVLLVQKAGSGHFELTFRISHALYDGFSLSMLTDRFRELVDDIESQPKISSHSFSEHLNRIASYASQQEFWTDYLSGVDLLHSDAGLSHAATKHVHVVRADGVTNLSPILSYVRRMHLPLQSLLLAAYATLHAQRLRKLNPDNVTVDNVLIGIYLASRNIEGADEIVAPTLSFVPIRVRQPLQRSLLDIARGIQADMREISEDGRGQVGLWQLSAWTNIQIKVDVWVNILREQKRPEGIETADGVTKSTRVISGERSQDVEKEYPPTRSEDDVPNGLLLKSNPVRRDHDYPMLDVEITIKDDSLDVGILAPVTLLDVADAKNVIDAFATLLHDAVRD